MMTTKIAAVFHLAIAVTPDFFKKKPSDKRQLEK